VIVGSAATGAFTAVAGAGAGRAAALSPANVTAADGALSPACAALVVRAGNVTRVAWDAPGLPLCAPALAAADVSLAIGTIGTAAAMENADIVLLRDSIAPIPWAIRLARAAQRTIRINLIIALSAMTLMAIATLVGSRIGHPIPLSLGVLAHEGGTVIVVLNSLLLLRFRDDPP
jgi:hypothetical protein